MQRRSLIVFVILNILVSIGVALAVIQFLGGQNTGGSSVAQVITVEVVYTATTAPTQTPFIVTVTPPEGVVLLPTDLFGAQTPGTTGTGGTTGSAGGANSAQNQNSGEAGAQSASAGTQIPDNCVLHTIVDGDTPFGIAEQYEVDGFQLLEANGLTEETSVFLQIGQVLIVPTEGCAATQSLFGDAVTETPIPTEEVEPPTPTATATSTGNPPTATSAPATSTATATVTTTPTTTPTNTATLPPTAENAQMEILSVQNPGVVTAEYIEIRNNGNTVNISGWLIRDGQGNEYTFAEQFLFNRGSVRLYTGSGGTDTATVKYWRQPAAVWERGDTATLLDSSGRVQSTFTIQ